MNLLCQDCDEMCSAIMIANDYHAQDLHQIATNQKHLLPEKRIELEELLRKHSPLFSGNLGCWQGPELDIELKPGSMPYHCQQCVPAPHTHQANLDIEVNRLCDVGVTAKTDGFASSWCAPSFVAPKKDGKIRFVTDHHELNKCIERHPWPMPHIADMIENVGKHRCAACLDLSMGFYHATFRPIKQIDPFCAP